MKTRLPILACLVLAAGSAHAAPLSGGTSIGIDFGPTAPTNNFNKVDHNDGNYFGSLSAGSIIDIAGTVVDDVAFAWENAVFINDDSADSSDLPGQPAAFNDSNLTDWIVEGGSTARSIILTFSGLDDLLTYDLLIGSGFIANSTRTTPTHPSPDWNSSISRARAPQAPAGPKALSPCPPVMSAARTSRSASSSSVTPGPRKTTTCLAASTSTTCW